MYAIEDPVVASQPRLGLSERVAQTVLRNERDFDFLVVLTTASVFLLPIAIVMFALPNPPWWLGVIHLVVMLNILDRFILMNHNMIHYPVFKKEYKWINTYTEWVLMPLFGMTPRTYFAHHIGMHHPENNGVLDASSTMRFQRDNPFHFLRYLTRFYFISIFDVARYMMKKNRTKLTRQMLTGELSIYVLFAVTLYFKPMAALFVLVLPFVITRFLMMAGNWGQHAFIDAADPLNAYKNAITCINTRYNRRAFNDGYHIAHHLYPRMHWTEMPQELERNRKRYEEEGAIIFEKIDFFIVWLFLMLHRYDWLAKFCVSHQGDKEEVIAFLKTRLTPIRES
ncbi:MAG: fatty acid desaturase [Deltaproteobacteria bacterium]